MADDLRIRIREALRVKDVPFAHVLLHSLAHIYSHTPYRERMTRLKPFVSDFPTLCTCCIKSCSQTGKDEVSL